MINWRLYGDENIMKDFIEINGNKFTDLEKAKDYFDKQLTMMEESDKEELNELLKRISVVKRRLYGDKTLFISVSGVVFQIT